MAFEAGCENREDQWWNDRKAVAKASEAFTARASESATAKARATGVGGGKGSVGLGWWRPSGSFGYASG